jgi:nitrite reductase/ring-hydroxylating ferredoxin subunit
VSKPISQTANQPSWVFAIEERDLKENGASIVFPKGLSVVLIKKDGRIYALSNKCAHMGCGMEGGVLKDYFVQCPCHDWRYDIRTGEFLETREIKIRTFPWRLEDGKIYINIQEGGRS